MRAPASEDALLDVSIADATIGAIIQAFDGHDYDVNGQTCRVNVYGVHEDGARTWVQLVIEGAKQSLVTLCLSGGAKASISKVA